MHLASDYIHPTPRGGRCRIRVHLPEEEHDASVVICSELPSLATKAPPSPTLSTPDSRRGYPLPQAFGVSPVWIYHYPKEATDGASETFELVVFPS
jgi:hypothetical protein